MHAKARYLVVAVLTACTLSALYYGTVRDPYPSAKTPAKSQRLSSFLQGDDLLTYDVHMPSRTRRDAAAAPSHQHRHCRMDTCFDFSRCGHQFKVYVYPDIQDKVSSRYRDILSVIRASKYYTSEPRDACIFVLALDTLDRDKLSTDDYVFALSKKIASLSLWNNGQNHLVFNLYSGTWEHYYEDDLGFDIGKAMLAKASISESMYRSDFDISYPLINRDHPLKGGDPGFLNANTVPPVRKYTLSFKGKRYLVGIGSESRDALYHIHNGEDIVLLTTCQHGNLPKDKRDKRCKSDEEEYDKWDFKTLLHNSTFCLVPRGRRLGSYRFLESLQAGCVPVLLSNQWVLPFSEVIDWSKAAVWADERLLLQVPSIVRSISNAEILAMRQQTQFLWDTYFSSTEKIISTTLEIVRERVAAHVGSVVRSAGVWNSIPGGLVHQPAFSPDASAYPTRLLSPQTLLKYTAVVYMTLTSSVISASSSPLYKLVKNLAKSPSLHKILVLWHSDAAAPQTVKWPVPTQVQLLIKPIQSINMRFYPYEEIETTAVLNLDHDVVLLKDEAEFAFHVWQHFPQRLVGYPSRSHYWDERRQGWAYSSKWTNDYSMVLTSAAIYHKYYGFLYHHIVPQSILDTIHTQSNCEDILMNFLVSHVTKLPPVKLTQRRRFKESFEPRQDSLSRETAASQSVWLTAEHFAQRQYCVDTFTQHFGYMPLRRSQTRLDPLLYKDPVSMTRKKYRELEHS